MSKKSSGYVSKAKREATKADVAKRPKATAVDAASAEAEALARNNPIMKQFAGEALKHILHSFEESAELIDTGEPKNKDVTKP
jgi:hypothetical protein